MKWIWIGCGALFLIFGSIWFFTSLYRPGYYTGGYYGMPMMGWGGGWMLGAGIFGIILVCFLIMVALRFTTWGPMGRGMGCGMGGMGRYAEAEEILRQRYARGEITKDQYDKMLRDLRN